MTAGKLYRGKGTKARQLAAFRGRYGKRGAAVYGAVVGKVAREQVRPRPSATSYFRMEMD